MESVDIEQVKTQIRDALGRDFDVVQTTGGKYVVEFFDFNSPPPPLGDTEDEAMILFRDYIVSRKENTDGRDNP